VPQASDFAPAWTVTDRTQIDDIRDAMLQAQLARLPASGIVMHFTDWAQIETPRTRSAATSSATRRGASPPLWGRPVVETEISDFLNHFLTGGFQGGAMIMDREDANVVIATENEDDFVKNMITIRCEERLGLQVKRPEAFIYGEFRSGT
jgi:HK97 family phage major capsid protein